MRFYLSYLSGRGRGASFILSAPICACQLLQAAEFNLRLVATSIETSLKRRCSFELGFGDSTVRRYISRKISTAPRPLPPHEPCKEKYYSAPCTAISSRFLLPPERPAFAKFGPLNSSAAQPHQRKAVFLTKVLGLSSPPTRCCPAVELLHRHQPTCPLRQGHLAPGQHLPCWIPPLSPTRPQATA